MNQKTAEDDKKFADLMVSVIFGVACLVLNYFVQKKHGGVK